MKFLYWNLHLKSNLENLIADSIIENDVDIAIFSEFKKTDFGKVKFILNNSYKLLKNCGGCENVIVLFKDGIVLSTLLEHKRYLFFNLLHSDKNYLIVGLHLPSNTNGDKSSDRKKLIRKIIDDLAENEDINVSSCIVIGDMNASPFDMEMVEKDAFNAVLFKKIIKQKEIVTFQGDNYKRFYNPCLEYITELNESYGSFYYGSGNGCLYWYCFDQILVRKNLADNIKSFKYLKKIKQKSLINKMKPNAAISDHLPLLVEISI